MAASAISGWFDEPLLDLDAVDVLAAADDHVLLAVGDEEEALVVEVADVAGVQPAVGIDRLGGGLGLVPVAGHEDRAGDAHLAGLARRRASSPSASTIFSRHGRHGRPDRGRLVEGVLAGDDRGHRRRLGEPVGVRRARRRSGTCRGSCAGARRPTASRRRPRCGPTTCRSRAGRGARTRATPSSARSPRP